MPFWLGTAVKVSIGKYLEAPNPPAFTRVANPAGGLVQSATRTWSDRNSDFVPQASELGPLNPTNCGTPVVSSRYADDVLTNRISSWELAAQVQHEIYPRVSVNVGYFRRWYDNLRVTDNLSIPSEASQRYPSQQPSPYPVQSASETADNPAPLLPTNVDQILVRVATETVALLAYRARGYGSERVPNGPVILAPNHASFMDHFFAGAFIRRRVQFMGKSQLVKGIGAWGFSHGGVFPVRRGYQDEEAFITSFRILARGGAIVMYCEAEDWVKEAGTFTVEHGDFYGTGKVIEPKFPALTDHSWRLTPE